MSEQPKSYWQWRIEYQGGTFGLFLNDQLLPVHVSPTFEPIGKHIFLESGAGVRADDPDDELIMTIQIRVRPKDSPSPRGFHRVQGLETVPQVTSYEDFDHGFFGERRSNSGA